MAIDPNLINAASNAQSGLSNLFSGLFINSGAPYEEAEKQFQKYGQMGAATQSPFYNAGVGALGPYQNWLTSMKDPAAFINAIMQQYSQSPFAKFSQQQNIRSAQNLGSASGLTGSSPLALQTQQNAQNISSQDMQNFLANVLGINTSYGQGYQNLIGTGTGAANALTNLYGDLGKSMAEAEYGRKAGENQDFANTMSGLIKLFL